MEKIDSGCKQVTVTMSEAQIERLRRESAERGMGVSAYVRMQLFSQEGGKESSFADTIEYRGLVARIERLERQAPVPVDLLSSALTSQAGGYSRFSEGRPSLKDMAQKSRSSVGSFDPDEVEEE